MAKESNVLNLPVSGNSEPEQPAKTKPEKTLPSDRIVMAKQLDYLRAYAATSGFGANPVRSTEVAVVAKASVTTLHIINAFWVDIGLLTKGEGGFSVAPAAVNYARAFEWNPKTAGHRLAAVVKATWFGAEVNRKLTYRTTMPEEEVIADLANLAGAGKTHRKSVRLLIDLMEAAGLVMREGDSLRRATPSTSDEQGASAPEPAPERSAESHQSKEVATAQSGRSAATTAFTQSPDGVVQFHVSVRVDMAEFSSWTPDRITAFFGGIAQVLSAKGDVEQERTGS